MEFCAEFREALQSYAPRRAFDHSPIAAKHGCPGFRVLLEVGIPPSPGRSRLSSHQQSIDDVSAYARWISAFHNRLFESSGAFCSFFLLYSGYRHFGWPTANQIT
jgi:hypothetical protein